MASSHEILTHAPSKGKDMQDSNLPFNPGSGITKNKTWQEIKQAVRSSRKLHAQFANKIPHDFNFVKTERSTDKPGSSFSCDRDVFYRLFFLGVLPEQRENSLIYVDVPNEQKSSLIDKPIAWNQVLGMFQPSAQTDKYSKEEELLRERKRLGSHGITSYEISQDKSRLLFPAAGSLFTMELEEVRNGAVIPKEIFFQHKGPKLDPKMCPEDPHIISYVLDNDLWVTDIRTGSEKRLTFSHKGTGNILDDPVSSGVTTYIMQEEFDRYTGYWWQPNNATDVHRILYEEVDESNVEISHIANFLGQPGVDSYRYPRTGTPNPTVTLKLVEFTVDKGGQISEPVIKNLSQSLEQVFPWYEYIARINWLHDGKGIWIQLLDRLQQKTAIVYFSLETFTSNLHSTTCDVEMTDDSSPVENAESCFRVIYEETSPVWINVHDTYYFFKNTAEDEIEFIWASEKTGHRHLYHIRSNIYEQNGTKRQRHNSGEPYNSVASVIPITTGNWEVLETPDSLWVDEQKKLVYFIALKDSVLESHLYVTSYENVPCVPSRLTQPGHSHAVRMDEDCNFYVTVYSSTQQLYSANIYSLSNSASMPRPSLFVNLLEPIAFPVNYQPPELFTFKNSQGTELHGMYYKPPHMQPGKKYPTVLYVYGGPHVQLVTNSFKGLRFQRLYTLSTLGYVVVAIDGRGSSHRGLEFESIFKHKMGRFELQDQVEGLRYLSEQINFIDMTRIAVHGWSYGGYLTLMGLVQRPEIFKVGIAGAPVTCWKLYDTGYTERYMGTPSSNLSGYHYGSLLNQASNFPDEPNRLFFVHGVIDENVHFVHTAQLISALVKNCKPYHLQIYPNERHGIRSAECNEHYEVVVINYLQQYL